MPQEIRTLEIATKAGPLKAKYEILDPKRVMILIAKRGMELPFHPGSMMIFNRARGIWTVNENGLFSAWRAGGHIKHNGGAVNGVRDSGELLELFRYTRDAREFVYARFDMDSLPVRAQTMHIQAFDRLVHALRKKTNVQKVIALMNFERARQSVDSLGRNNPSAANMAAGAGIGRLLERRADVKHILSRVNVRTFRMWKELKRIERCYRELLRLLGGRSGKSRSVETLPVLAASDVAIDWKLIEVILEEQMEVFCGIRAQPFRKNKFQLARDLRVLRDAFARDGIRSIENLRRGASGSDAEKYRSELDVTRRGMEARMAVMRQGITWMLAKFHLEIKIIAPLSWLMADVRADQSVMLRANGQPTRGELEIHSSMQPARFQSIRERADQFMDRASQRNDGLLRTRVKKNVLAHMEEARLCMKQEDWERAKEELEFASSYI